MKNIYLICNFLLISLIAHSQSVSEKINKEFLGIYLDEFKLTIYPQKYPDTIVEKLSDTSTIELHLQRPKGKSTFCIFNLANQKQVEGGYADTLDVFKRYALKFDMNVNGTISVEKFYQPIPIGEWVYYSNKGGILRKVKYYYRERSDE